jgi:acid phosphatase type 7
MSKPSWTRSAKAAALLLILAIVSFSAVLTPQTTPGAQQASPATSPAATPVRDPVIMAAGDIACGSATQVSTGCRHQQTADLIIDANPDAVLALGDIQYECGQINDFMVSFDASWGQFKEKIRPAVGNHEYQVSRAADGPCPNATPGAPGYYSYFGDAASPQEPGCRVECEGYYSWDIGTWHMIALNSECRRVGGCQEDSPQHQWLVNDLAQNLNDCVLAYWHQPRFSSGRHGSFPNYESLWEALYEAGADVILVGHDHDYERFAPQSPNGGYDPDFGIRQFVVGTGGRNLTPLNEETGLLPNSEAFNNISFGVLKMTLHPNGYDWEFVPVVEEDSAPFTDSGSDNCHDAPPADHATPDIQVTASVPSPTPPSPPTTQPDVATPAAASLPFVDGFETGDLTNWSEPTGLVVQGEEVASGTYAVRAQTSGDPAFARRQLSEPQPELHYRLKFKLISRDPDTVNLLKFRTAEDESIVTVGITRQGTLVFRNDIAEVSARSEMAIAEGEWHELQVRVLVNGDTSEIELWLDGTRVEDLSRIESFGSNAIGYIQLGENSSGTAFDIVFDDVAVDTTLIPPDGP